VEGNTNIKINADKPQMTFVFPSFYDLERGMAFTHSLGIGYIRANLAQHHIPTAQYIQYQPRTVPQTAREILDMGADIVGFSCVDGSFYPCIIIANAIKKMKSDTTIVFGGPAVTLAADMIMKQNQCIDICCRGECEETCYELLLRLKANGEINDIPGVSYRSNGGVRHAPDRPLIHRGKKGEELDFLPSPYLANMIPTDSDLPEDEFQLAILTSRGCTHKCTYCTNTMLGRNRVRFHSVDRVIAELKYLSRKCKPFQKVVFFDDTFTLNINRAKQICRRMFDESLHHLDYECITRFDRCDEELFKLFAQVGIRCVAFGLESASPEVLNRIKKVRSTRAVNGDYGPEQRFVDTIKQNIALSKKYRIRASLSIMVGLPGETPGEANATLDFIKELNLNSYNHNYLIPIYGTELFNQCDNYGISVKPSPFQLPFITDYSYDVYAREPLENSLVHQEFARRNQQGIEILFSIFVGVQQKMHQFLHPENTALFITDPPRLDDGDLFLWLSPILHFNSDIFITEQQWDFQTRQHRYQLFARANIPVVQYRRLKVKREEKKCGPNQNDTVETYDMENFSKTLLSTKKYSYKHGADYTYHLLPLNCDYPSPIDLDNQIKLRSIGSMEDISQLVKGCENHSHSLKITGAQLSHFDFEIVDKCRWSGQLCKALELKKLIIKGNKDVYTCYSGQPLGQVGMPFDQLKIELAASQEEMVKRRGCPDCPVLESCPQCMYLPSFLSESNYCRVMQQYKNISIAMELPGLMRQLRIQKADEIKELEYLQISWIDKKRVKSILLPAKQEQENSSGFPGWLLKIDFNNRHFLYYTEKSEFSVLSGTMSEMWDLIRDQPVDDREAICQRLAKTHHISYNALFNTFDMFCKKIGNLISRAY
jgi:radical SAM superfamily enzyme YgiQ (UPF0313 family)